MSLAPDLPECHMGLATDEILHLVWEQGLLWTALDRLVKIMSDQGSLVEKNDQLQIDREVLEDECS